MSASHCLHPVSRSFGGRLVKHLPGVHYVNLFLPWDWVSGWANSEVPSSQCLLNVSAGVSKSYSLCVTHSALYRTRIWRPRQTKQLYVNNSIRKKKKKKVFLPVRGKDITKTLLHLRFRGRLLAVWMYLKKVLQNMYFKLSAFQLFVKIIGMDIDVWTCICFDICPTMPLVWLLEAQVRG